MDFNTSRRDLLSIITLSLITLGYGCSEYCGADIRIAFSAGGSEWTRRAVADELMAASWIENKAEEFEAVLAGREVSSLFFVAEGELLGYSIILREEIGGVRLRMGIGGARKFSPRAIIAYRDLVSRLQSRFGGEAIEFDKVSTSGQSLFDQSRRLG